MGSANRITLSISLLLASLHILRAQDHIIFVDISDIENVADVKSKLMSMTDSLDYYNRPFALVIHNSPKSIVSDDADDYQKAIDNIMFIDPSVPVPFETIWLIDSVAMRNSIGAYDKIHVHIFSSNRNLQANYLQKRMINNLLLTLTKKTEDPVDQSEVFYYFPLKEKEIENSLYKNIIFY